MVDAYLKFEGKLTEATSLWKHFDAKVTMHPAGRDYTHKSAGRCSLL